MEAAWHSSAVAMKLSGNAFKLRPIGEPPCYACPAVFKEVGSDSKRKMYIYFAQKWTWIIFTLNNVDKTKALAVLLIP